MNVRAVGICVIALVIAALLASPGCKRGAARRGGAGDEGALPAPSGDPKLAGAYEAVEKFVKAWRNKDAAAARKLMSPKMLAFYSEQQIADQVVGLPNHVHKDAAITAERVLGDDRVQYTVEFRIVLQGMMNDRPGGQRMELQVGRQGEKWMIEDMTMPQASNVPTG